MSVSVTWDNDQQSIIRFQFADGWEWNEFHAAVQDAQDLLATVGHIVDIIADFQHTSFVPTETLARLAYVGSPCPINLGSIVLVGSKEFSTTTLAVFRSYYSSVAQSFAVAHSVERGRALLARAEVRYPVIQKMMFA